MRSLRTPALVAMGSVACMVAAFACTVEDENPGTERRDGGTTVGTADTGTNPSNTSTTAMCVTLGGPTVVRNIADGILARVKGDCRLGGAFDNVDETHLSDCFGIQIQA